MSARRPASLMVYAAVAGAAGLVAPAWLGRRLRRGQEDPARWRERLGVTAAARPPGRLAWLHGVSVGEAVSLTPLVERLRAERSDVTILLTSGTRASADLIGARLAPIVVHQYAPLDTPAAVGRFLDHWRPEVGVLVESELWPNLILGARDRGVRLALLSAKVSDATLAGWRRVPAAARAVLAAFELVMARDEAAAGRLAALGARVQGLADLKFGAAPLPVDAGALLSARDLIAGQTVIVASSTHPGEEESVFQAFRQARGAGPAILVVVPRHPQRGAAVATLARDAGLDVGLHTAGDTFGDHPTHVADTVGDLGLWYRLASLALVGGSLAGAGVGGHNPFEPARLDCPFIAGPEVDAWPAYLALQEAGATRLVRTADLVSWFARAIAGDPALSAMSARARAFVAAGDVASGHALDAVMDLVGE